MKGRKDIGRIVYSLMQRVLRGRGTHEGPELAN
jgi:hypothetical protein